MTEPLTPPTTYTAHCTDCLHDWTGTIRQGTLPIAVCPPRWCPMCGNQRLTVETHTTSYKPTQIFHVQHSSFTDADARRIWPFVLPLPNKDS